MSNNNILIDGYFGYNNLGDDLLLKEALNKIPLKYNLYVMFSPSSTEELAGIDCFRKYRDFRLLTNKTNIHCRTYKALIYSGGGIFPARTYGLKNLISSLVKGLTAKSIIVNGCGIVPKENSRFFKLFMKTVKYCSVRDCMSKKYIQSIHCNAIQCGDLYWGNNCDTSNICRNPNTCLVCLANPFSDKEKEDPYTLVRYRKFVNQLAEFIINVKARGIVVTYLPFFRGSDEILISDIQQHIGTNDVVLKFGVDYNLESVDKLFAQYSIGLCMRFHSILLAIKNRLPMVAINYDYKSEALLQEAALGEYGVRFGIRKSQFFGEERDLDIEILYCSLEMAITKKDDYIAKAIAFRNKKYQSVIDNYKRIFELI